ncbi:hypothetical protein [Clostridium beijerinckii]|jgi:N-acetylglutamate synthase (EC 2.3.1.1)|uniref:Uncharacterized protein n=1 Tax=Clostridium beijerinckii TaxID=1520 RepID=A0AAE2RTA6_CLOBE|nr:hypothetical protein [Clostridium beijerinckii]MBF7810001.1 hypothetical protein [Clostridium beijerinckii]NOW90582.1 hypothetical protein [Clostridium beijerinckii]NRT23232.1 hypothetical protein [Clostridium beijerinckii]NRT69198.1 hypothetical protein [Clostridium beijerinckii]NRT84652.1 hypothetical protein [Clostridium beijerinckii]
MKITFEKLSNLSLIYIKLKEFNVKVKTIQALKEQGISEVALVAFETNELGNSFWESQGFEERDDLVYRNKILNDINV